MNVSECIRPEFGMFSELGSQDEITNTQWLNYAPLTAISQNHNIKFRIINAENYFLKLDSCYIIANFIYRVDDGSDASGEKIIPVNNFLHSFFKDVKVHLNNIIVSEENYNYHYKAYIQTLFNHNSDDQENILSSSGWYKDTAKNFNILDDNLGGLKRDSFWHASAKHKTVQLAAPLKIDLFNIQDLLLNNVAVDIELVLNDNTNFLFQSEKVLSMGLTNISLYIQQVGVNPSIKHQIENKLQHNNAIYPFVKGYVKTYDIAQEKTSFTMDNLFLGRLPSRIIIGMVETGVFNGESKEKNPYNFDLCNMSYVALFKNGLSVSGHPYQPHVESKQIMRSYLSLFQSTHSFYNNKSVNINMADYLGGYGFWAFDLTADKCGHDFHNDRETGSVKLDLKFQGLSIGHTLIVYSDYNSMIQITKDRNILSDIIVQ